MVLLLKITDGLITQLEFLIEEHHYYFKSVCLETFDSIIRMFGYNFCY